MLFFMSWMKEKKIGDGYEPTVSVNAFIKKKR
jgi:hypothetical protein